MRDSALTGSLSALNDSLALALGDGETTGTFAISGTWVATLTFQGLAAGSSTWRSINATNLATNAIATTTTGNGDFLVNCAGFAQIRVSATAYTSGTAVGTANAGIGLSTVTIVDASGAGATQVQGPAADGAAVVGNPVRIGGKDGGGLTQDIITDTTGNLVTVGAGVAGTPAGGVVSVQGVASGTVLPTNTAQINGVATTMGNGISGTGVQRVTLASDSTGQVALAAGVATIGALTANQSVNAAQVAGAATSVNNGTADAGTQRVVIASNNTNFNVQSGSTNIASETSLAKLTLAQASTTATQTGPLAQAAVTTGAPSYTTAQTSPLSLTTAGALRTDASATTQPANVTQLAGTAASVNNGTVDAGTLRVTLASNSTGQVTLAAGVNSIGAVSVGLALPTGANTIGAVTQASGPWTQNLTQANGNALLTGNGATGTGSPRVTLANDGPSIGTAGSAAPTTATMLGYHDGANVVVARAPTIFKTFDAVSINAETTIWTPASGKKFRLLAYHLSASVAGNITLRDNTAGSTIAIVPSGAGGSGVFVHWGEVGTLSGAINRVLTAQGPAASTLSGFVCGTEE